MTPRAIRNLAECLSLYAGNGYLSRDDAKRWASDLIGHAKGIEREGAAAVEARKDTEMLDWLQAQLVDTIYLNDGRIIDVAGRYTLRHAIHTAREKGGKK